MTKNAIVLSVIAVLLGTAYIYFFSGCFNKETIQITWRISPNRALNLPRDPKAPPVYPVSFLLRGSYKLTSVKVVSAEEFATNKHAKPLWHLNSRSVSTKSFEYGGKIPGMKPAVPGANAESLEPDVPYLLLVEAGSVKGSTNFFTKEFAPRGTR